MINEVTSANDAWQHEECTHQSEGSQHRETLHAFQAQFQKRESDDDEIEDVPTLLKIIFRTHRYKFQSCFDTKCRREELKFQSNYSCDKIFILHVYTM